MNPEVVDKEKYCSNEKLGVVQQKINVEHYELITRYYIIKLNKKGSNEINQMTLFIKGC